MEEWCKSREEAFIAVDVEHQSICRRNAWRAQSPWQVAGCRERGAEGMDRLKSRCIHFISTICRQSKTKSLHHTARNVIRCKLYCSIIRKRWLTHSASTRDFTWQEDTRNILIKVERAVTTWHRPEANRYWEHWPRHRTTKRHCKTSTDRRKLTNICNQLLPCGLRYWMYNGSSLPRWKRLGFRTWKRD